MLQKIVFLFSTIFFILDKESIDTINIVFQSVLIKAVFESVSIMFSVETSSLEVFLNW